MKIRLIIYCLCAIGISSHILAQDTIPNPSLCNMGLILNDATCPDDKPLFSPNRFPIRVTNVSGTQLGVDVYLKEVRLIIRHNWVSDLDIALESPGGQQIELSSDNGGGDSNYGDSDSSD